MKASVDRKRREAHFNVGDLVWVHLQPYRQSSLAERVNNKLCKRYFGPFAILKRIGQVAYKLDLPLHAKIHHTFHVSLLKPYKGDNTITSFPLPEVFTNGLPVLEPQAIVDSRRIAVGDQQQVELKVRWHGVPQEVETWEDFNDFRRQYPHFNLEDKVSFNGVGINMNETRRLEEEQAAESGIEGQQTNEKEMNAATTSLAEGRARREIRRPKRFTSYLFAMFSNSSNKLPHQETACDLLLQELQIIWDEIGESDSQKDAMLLEIERKCLEFYRKQVDEAKQYKEQIQQEIDDYEAEIASICAAMGEQPLHIEPKSCGSLKKGRETVVSQLDEMHKLKTERKKQFLEVLHQLQNISCELYGSVGVSAYFDENNLSLKRLEELQKQLLQFQNEKASRLKQVADLLNTLNSLCLVLGLDVKDKICEICPKMVNATETRDVSDHTVKNLSSEVQRLREVKIQRMQKLQSLATELLEMWNLMDTPLEEQQEFHNITSNIAALESEFTAPNMLSIDFVIYVEREVRRLQQLKSAKMKELLLRKKLELDEICRSTRLTTQIVFSSEHPNEFLESESVSHENLLEQIEHQITKTKEEALSRKEILEKVDKWLAASQEESWLEEYNRDDNRYNAGRGAHLVLKRAEKARALLSKIPGMVEEMISKVTAWENERGLEFLYEGSRLLSMLEDYSTLRQEKENERQRHRDQKKLQGQLMAEHEVLFGSKPSPSISGKKASRCSIGVPSIRKFSVGGAMLQGPRQAALIEQSNKKGKDTSKVIGHSVKNTAYSAEKEFENQSPVTEKPLSPVSSTVMSKANITTFQEDHSKIQNVPTQSIQQQVQTLTGTPPSKPFIAGDEENRTPKNMGLPVPTTPLTSVFMLTATTPDGPDTLSVYPGSTVATKSAQLFEYSFEEMRAGFILPKNYAQ
ncbi:65-kDa microtubule-associated protein 3-like [Gastrolobium bilobum]|uniref:65-kDa microtubule-associated protein 3-like n=1 Tax=Gastrolobium bilobum TaxID=150636 RepID=UPI002AB20853|nr:65-kDa microtubule-associated protein 3-like [Gastrolobium bilobum]